jgi:ketosteroid isomerase-like protein
MSREDVELVRTMLATFVEVDEGLVDRQRLNEFFSPDATWDLRSFLGWMEEPEFRGLDSFLEFRAGWMQPYDDWSYELEKLLDAGADRVLGTFHQRGKPQGSDSWIEQHYAIVYTVEDGLISRAQVYATPEAALRAAGSE